MGRNRGNTKVCPNGSVVKANQPCPTGSSPVVVTYPTLSGSTTVGSLLVSSNGTWSNSPTSFAYQWFRNGSGISGATTNQYTTLSTDASASIYCRVTATNAYGYSIANSNTDVITATVPAPQTSSLQLGLNMIDPFWWTFTTPWVDIGMADDFITNGGTYAGQYVPEINRDANGYPTSLPTGASFVVIGMQPVSVIEPRVLTWSGNSNCITSADFKNFASVSYDLANNKILYTPDNLCLQSAETHAVNLKYVMSGSAAGQYPTNFIDRPVSDTGNVLTNEFHDKVTQITTSDGPIRLIKHGTVERNCTPIHDPADTNYQFPGLHFPNPATEPGTQLSEPMYNSTNRNTNINNPTRRDGVPVERLIATVTALGRDAWYNLPWNAEDSFYSAVAALWATFAQTTGHKVYVEMSNEVWNPGYTVFHQNHNEAGINGITNEINYARKSIHGFSFFETAFASAGVSSKLVRVLCWQNYGDPTIWDNIAADGTTINHVDLFAVAPYYGDNGNMNIPVTYNTSITALETAIHADIDDTLNHAVNHLAKANAHGKLFGCYEGGITVTLTDMTFKQAFARSISAYNLEKYWLQQIATRLGNIPVCMFAYSYPLGADNYQWGRIEYSSQPASITTTPKWQADYDFIHGL